MRKRDRAVGFQKRDGKTLQSRKAGVRATLKSASGLSASGSYASFASGTGKRRNKASPASAKKKVT